MIKQASEKYAWRAVYRDNTSIQENEDNSFSSNVDKERVGSLSLLPLQGGIGHTIDIPEGTQAIFFRRRRMILSATDDTVLNHSTSHCIGWKNDEHAAYLFVLADGTTLFTDDLQAV